MLAAHDDKRNPGAGIASPTMPWALGPAHGRQEGQALGAVPPRLAARPLPGRDRRDRGRGGRRRQRQARLPARQGAARRRPLPAERAGRPAARSGRASRWTSRRSRSCSPGSSSASTPRPGASCARTAEFIVRHGPETEQDRWENQSGYSPGTIAAEIAGLVCAADLARRNGATADAARYERVADRWANAVQRWTATTNGPVLRRPVLPAADQGPPAGPRHALQHRRRRPEAGRPAQGRRPELPRARAARRQAVRRPGDPQHARRSSTSGCARQTPNGAFWHRFTYDGYGETREGGGWRLTKENSRLTFGRVWPIFAGERGEYELLAGRPADTYLKSIADAGNDGGMIPEQVWDGRAADQHAGGRGDLLGDPARVVARAARAPGLVDRCGGPGGAAFDRRLQVRTDVSVAALSSVADLAPERGFSLPGAS